MTLSQNLHNGPVYFIVTNAFGERNDVKLPFNMLSFHLSGRVLLMPQFQPIFYPGLEQAKVTQKSPSELLGLFLMLVYLFISILV